LLQAILMLHWALDLPAGANVKGGSAWELNQPFIISSMGLWYRPNPAPDLNLREGLLSCGSSQWGRHRDVGHRE